jgi:hypothetical protein
VVEGLPWAEQTDHALYGSASPMRLPRSESLGLDLSMIVGCGNDVNSLFREDTTNSLPFELNVFYAGSCRPS